MSRIYRPRIHVVYGVRYEPDWLVREFRENMSWADELVEVDDRRRQGELWVHEGRYRMLQRRALIRAGIRQWDWVLVTSPDERWSANAGDAIRKLTSTRSKTIYSFPLREMWTPTRYRIDGMWGGKLRPRLYPFLGGQRFTRKRIQTTPVPVSKGYHRRTIPRVEIFHLENIDPASRIERAIVYEAMRPGSAQRAARSTHWRKHDPWNRYMRRFGWAYLADNRCPPLKLQKVAPDAFTPPVNQLYEFRVPGRLLVKECGRTRAQLVEWVTATLGVPESVLLSK